MQMLVDAIPILSVYFSGWFWFRFMVARVEWVHRVRVGLMQKDPTLYDRLPSVRAMTWKVWIWDPNRFFPQNPPPEEQ